MHSGEDVSRTRDLALGAHHLPDGPARPISRVDGEVAEAVDRLLHLIRRSGVPALSGPQIGYPWRVVAVDLSRDGRGPVVLVNPVLEAVSSERQVDREGCVNLPEVKVRVSRPVHVTVTALARSGQAVRLHAGGLLARILQHQFDHLDGISLLDHAPPLDRRLLERRAAARSARCEVADHGVVKDRTIRVET